MDCTISPRAAPPLLLDAYCRAAGIDPAAERAAIRQRQREDELRYRAAFFAGTAAAPAARPAEVESLWAELRRQADELRRLREETEEAFDYLSTGGSRNGTPANRR
jgi:hypothetical protein